MFLFYFYFNSMGLTIIPPLACGPGVITLKHQVCGVLNCSSSCLMTLFVGREVRFPVIWSKRVQTGLGHPNSSLSMELVRSSLQRGPEDLYVKGFLVCNKLISTGVISC